MQNLIPFIVLVLFKPINVQTNDVVKAFMNTQRPRIIHKQKTKLSEVLVLNVSEKDWAIVEKDGKQIFYAPIIEPSKNKITHFKKDLSK